MDYFTIRRCHDFKLKRLDNSLSVKHATVEEKTRRRMFILLLIKFRLEKNIEERNYVGAC